VQLLRDHLKPREQDDEGKGTTFHALVTKSMM